MAWDDKFLVRTSKTCFCSCKHHPGYYVPMSYLFYNWKFRSSLRPNNILLCGWTSFLFMILPSRLQCSGRMGVTQAKPSRQLKLSRSLGSRETKAGRVFKTEYLRGKSLHLEEILEVHGMFSLRYSARHWSVCKESTPKRHQRIKLFPDNCLITKLENMYRNIKLLNTQHSKIHNVWHPVRNY